MKTLSVLLFALEHQIQGSQNYRDYDQSAYIIRCIWFEIVLSYLRIVYNGKVFWAETSAILCDKYAAPTCLGNLGKCDTNRLIYICVVSPKVAKGSKSGINAVSNRRCFWPKNFANVNTALDMTHLDQKYQHRNNT
jgi:hypothetical protein